jgi:hypothetical protein
MRGLTSTDDAEIRACVQTLKAAHAGTGYLPEFFHKDDPNQYARAWPAGATSLCGEFLWKLYKERPSLLRMTKFSNREGLSTFTPTRSSSKAPFERLQVLPADLGLPAEALLAAA